MKRKLTPAERAMLNGLDSNALREGVRDLRVMSRSFEGCSLSENPNNVMLPHVSTILDHWGFPSVVIGWEPATEADLDGIWNGSQI